MRFGGTVSQAALDMRFTKSALTAPRYDPRSSHEVEMTKITNWSLDDFDDGAAYVRLGMRPRTDREVDAAGLSLGATNDSIFESLVTRSEALLDGGAQEEVELPGCQHANPAAKRNDDIGARTGVANRRRKQRRRSRSADARLVEAKRAKEAAFDDHHLDAVRGAEGRHVGVLPIEKDTISSTPTEKDTISSTPTPASSTSSIPSVSATSSGGKSDKEGMAVSDAGSTLVPWWQKEIRRNRYFDRGAWRDNLSIKRRSIPEWRDLSNEARLDFFQDAGIKIAASRPDHGFFHTTINLVHAIEKQAVSTPNALEWCKYRIAKAIAISGLPCTFLMVSEEAPVQSLAEQHRRSDLGLNPTRRFHVHSVMVLPSSKRAHQKLRDLLREDAVVGCWDETAKGRQISIKPGTQRYVVDYLAKDLHLAGKMHQWHDAYPGGFKYRGYQGESITVSNDLRDEAIRLYADWRKNS